MHGTIHPATRIGQVALTVSDLERSLAFYQERLGFGVHRREAESATLGAGGLDLLALYAVPGARPAQNRSGLYHFAVLYPERLSLARALQRVAATRTPVQGFADHGVSEAIYLPDPDQSGIELYWDRPRAEWPMEYGELAMVTEPLDLDDLLLEVERTSGGWNGLPAGTVIGHIHLHVAHIPEAIDFYRGVLGFDLMQRFGQSAAFLSAGGYHHHIGINTWAGVGAPPPPPGSTGLRWFVIEAPDQSALEAVLERIEKAGLKVESQADGWLTRDPSANGILLKAAA
jgi:catechol 2,3-dioxygenase